MTTETAEYTYSISTSADDEGIEIYTVLAKDSHGEYHDLNPGDDPCLTWGELEDFVFELCEQGAYGREIRDELLGEIEFHRKIDQNLASHVKDIGSGIKDDS